VSRTERFPPLSVDADLTLTVAGYEYEIRDRDDDLVVAAPSLSAAVALLGSLPEAGGIGRLLSTTGLAVEIRVRDVVVATTGPDVDGGILSRATGSLTVVHAGGLLRALAGEARARPSTVLALAVVLALAYWVVGRVRDGD